MGATRPYNPAARGNRWALPRLGKIGAEQRKNKPTLNTKLRVLPKMDQCRWVKPRLVCQVAFVEWTDAGHLRHCTFIGMRDDKKALEVVRET